MTFVISGESRQLEEPTICLHCSRGEEAASNQGCHRKRLYFTGSVLPSFVPSPEEGGVSAAHPEAVGVSQPKEDHSSRAWYGMLMLSRRSQHVLPPCHVVYKTEI